MEFTFPAIAQEDRSAKLKDIAFTEAMDYITKERAAVMAVREFQITDYDYEEEKQRIREERGEEPVMAQGLQQMPKIATDPNAAVEQPGLGADMVPGAEATKLAPGREEKGSNPVTQTSAQMGFRGNRRRPVHLQHVGDAQPVRVHAGRREEGHQEQPFERDAAAPCLRRRGGPAGLERLRRGRSRWRSGRRGRRCGSGSGRRGRVTLERSL